MCGFCGYYDINNYDGWADLIQEMNSAIANRGPDDFGIWKDEDFGIVLGHQRLAIVDLTSAGHQPMISTSGRFVIAFNGEIYNHLQLRKKLEEKNQVTSWRGHSDTETLLACFEAVGITDTLRQATGMFALAAWDKKSKQLTLARDRVGEKPLYYGWQGDSFLFGSELKALRAHPNFKNEIDRDALSLMMRHCYIPAPYSIYSGISKLMPGCMLTLSQQQPQPNIEPYWSAVDAVKAGLQNPFSGTAEEAVNQLEQRLKDVIFGQMLADVPLGAFLSGGIDSSTIVALMQAQSHTPIKTFTIGFDDKGYNEAAHAKVVAKHLGTDHTELYIPPKQAQNVIPRLPYLYDEPFADSSQIPTFLVSQLAKEHVTVSLSGDAGDELFCGYNRYHLTSKLWKGIFPVPAFLRRGVAKGITSISPEAWNKIAHYTPLRQKLVFAGDKLHKGADVLASHSVDELYYGLVSTAKHPELLVRNSTEPMTLLTGNTPKITGQSDVERMMLLDILTYLPDDILVKVDRAAMGVSLETRVPFLDHNIVEFALSLPLDYKLRDGQTKWPLRQILYKYVPQSLIDRPKMGFGIPLANWLRGPLKEWAEQLLNKERLDKEGYFFSDEVSRFWREHQEGNRNWAYILWNILMFQAWLEEHHGK